MSDNLSFFIPISKIEKIRDGGCIVSGYASTPTLDLDGEVVALSAIKKALPGYMAWKNIREMHRASAVGTAQEANIDDKGLFLTARIIDKEAAQKCIEKVYKGFSIGGRKLAKSGETITEIEMVEISVVDRPANPDCRFEVSKSAGDKVGAYLIRSAKSFRDPKDRAIRQLAKTVTALTEAGPEGSAEFLTKDGPKAARDGFSLPAKTKKSSENVGEKCAAHGIVGCEECKTAAAGKPVKTSEDDDVDDAGAREDTTKRDVSRKERKRLAREGKALPGGGFPINNKKDLANARQAVGRAKDPSAARALIRRRASELGVKLPPGWKKKAARVAIAEAALQKSVLGAPSFLDLPSDKTKTPKEKTASSFSWSPRPHLLTESLSKSEWKLLKSMSVAGQLSYCFDTLRSAQRLLMTEVKREGGDMKDKALAEKLGSLAQGLAAVIGQKAEHEGAEALDFSDADDQGFLNLGGLEMSAKVKKGMGGGDGLTFDTENISDPVAKAVLDMVKRASAPSRAARMTMARSDLKKARKAAKDLEDCVKAAHAMHKSAYLAKAANGRKKPDDDADDFDHQGAMEKLQKAFGDLQTVKTMMKSAGGQLKKAMSRSGQRGQEVSDGTTDYQVPTGIKDLTPGMVDEGDAPFVHGLEQPFPGKAVKARLAKFVKNGQIPVEIAEMLAENAALEGKVEALGKLPAGPVFGKKPSAFDMSKIVAGGKDEDAAIMKGVDPADLTKDETSNARAVSRMIGNMIIGGHGKSVFDNDFRGTGGLN